MKQIINDFINSIDTKLYIRIRASKGGAECRRYLKEHLQKQLTLTDVVSSFITADDEGKYFVVTTDYDDEIEKGSTVYLLRTYPEDIHLFTDKNGDEVWISADDVDRKE